MAKALFPGEERLGEVQSLADAALAIVEEVLKPVDVMKIQVLEESETEEGKFCAHLRFCDRENDNFLWLTRF